MGRMKEEAARLEDDILAEIPTWMELRIAAHKDAIAALGRADAELDVLVRASTAADPDNPPAWYRKAKHARDLASMAESEARAALLTERPRAFADAERRARYLVEAGLASSFGDALAFAFLAMEAGGNCGVPSATISKQANAFLASYVAIEAEQTRLVAEGRAAEADSLSSWALDISQAIRAIRTRGAGAADVVAARLLVDLMLIHPWPPAAEIDWSPTAREDILPILETVAGGTTGEIRRHVRLALSTAAIGVDLADEAGDPLLELVNAYRSGLAAFNAANGTSAEDDPALRAAWRDPYERLWFDPPVATTEAGAVAAIRLLVEEHALNEGGDEFISALLPAALAFFDGRA